MRMMRLLGWAGVVMMMVAGCLPAVEPLPEPGLDDVPGEIGPTATVMTTEETLEDEGATEDVVVATATVAPTLTAFEAAQVVVVRYRNRLEVGSDGYLGLDDAAQQDAANEAWCAGVSAGIQQFNYLNDAEAVAALSAVRDGQGCGQ